MSAPASTHAEVRRRVALIVERDYQPDPARCVAAIVKLLTYRPAVAASASTGDADLRSGDPPATAAQAGPADDLMQHEDRASFSRQGRGLRGESS
jgi:hypothetical protein